MNIMNAIRTKWTPTDGMSIRVFRAVDGKVLDLFVSHTNKWELIARAPQVRKDRIPAVLIKGDVRSDKDAQLVTEMRGCRVGRSIRQYFLDFELVARDFKAPKPVRRWQPAPGEVNMLKMEEPSEGVTVPQSVAQEALQAAGLVPVTT